MVIVTRSLRVGGGEEMEGGGRGYKCAGAVTSGGEWDEQYN
jgi:hypothetical protein